MTCRPRSAVHACLIAAALIAAGPVRAQTPAKVSNPAPAAKDWADIGKLPDWSGVWLPVGGPAPNAQPAWTPKAAAQIAAMKAAEAAGEPQNFYVNCLPEGMPSYIIMTVASAEILFTPGRVTILGEFDGNRLRRIYTDGRPHPADPDLTFNGHSIGHWEGDTLVVDTVGILPQAYLPLGQAVGLPNNGDLHIVERIRLTDADTLRDELEITAPHVLTAPWKVAREFKRTRDRASDLAEGSCRQGDFVDDVDANGNAIFAPLAREAGGAPVPSLSK